MIDLIKVRSAIRSIDIYKGQFRQYSKGAGADTCKPRIYLLIYGDDNTAAIVCLFDVTAKCVMRSWSSVKIVKFE